MSHSKDLRVLDAQRVIRRNIKLFRAWRGLTQDQAAKAADISLSNLTRWETGHRDMSAGALRVLADAYGCTPGDFFLDPPPSFLKRFIEPPYRATPAGPEVVCRFCGARRCGACGRDPAGYKIGMRGWEAPPHPTAQ